MAQIKELFDKILSIQELTINKLNDVNDKHQAHLSNYYTKAEIDEFGFLSGITSSLIRIKKDASTGNYTLVTTNDLGNDITLGEAITIEKDSFLDSVSANTENNTLTFTWNAASGKEQTTIPLSSIADVYKAGYGISIVEDGTISAIIDNTSESFLTVGANGIKLSGVVDKINAAVLSGIGDIDLTTNGIQNKSTVTGTTATDALNTLNTNIGTLNNFKNDAGDILSGSYLSDLDSRLAALEDQLSGI